MGFRKEDLEKGIILSLRGEEKRAIEKGKPQTGDIYIRFSRDFEKDMVIIDTKEVSIRFSADQALRLSALINFYAHCLLKELIKGE